MRSTLAPGMGFTNQPPAVRRPQSVDVCGKVAGYRNPPVTATASATPHATGAWTEVITSNAETTDWLAVSISGVNGSGTDTSQLVDIGIGAAGSEVAVVTSIPAGYASYLHLLLPLRILRSERVAVRNQALIASDTCYVQMATAPAPFPSPRRLVTMGADTANSHGTMTLTTDDTYAEITAATTEPFAGLVVLPSYSGATAIAQEAVLQTAAAGASGGEVPVATFNFFQTTAEAYFTTTLASTAGGGINPFFGTAAHHIPAGSRIAAKQNIGRTYRGVIVFGIPYA